VVAWARDGYVSQLGHAGVCADKSRDIGSGMEDWWVLLG
jgi:hypothetical protein